LRLHATRMIAAVRCAPPANKPTPLERDTCSPWFRRELELVLPSTRVIICLGKFGYDALLAGLASLGAAVPRPRPKFGHAVEHEIDGVTVIGCFHPSQQNTFTGKLTEPMTDAILTRARQLARL